MHLPGKKAHKGRSFFFTLPRKDFCLRSDCWWVEYYESCLRSACVSHPAAIQNLYIYVADCFVCWYIATKETRGSTANRKRIREIYYTHGPTPMYNYYYSQSRCNRNYTGAALHLFLSRDGRPAAADAERLRFPLPLLE